MYNCVEGSVLTDILFAGKEVRNGAEYKERAGQANHCPPSAPAHQPAGEPQSHGQRVNPAVPWATFDSPDKSNLGSGVILVSFRFVYSYRVQMQRFYGFLMF